MKQLTLSINVIEQLLKSIKDRQKLSYEILLKSAELF